ncbi:MAG: DUF488 domain-containing protein [Sulfuriferula sp.]
MRILTIGFTKKNAEKFFGILRRSEARRIIDVRLNNVSQLAGFAKKEDLQFFLKEICEMEYLHLPELAPTKDILDSYKNKKMSWDEYEARYLDLISQRDVARTVGKEILDEGCLLCSEDKPHQCHRRLVAEYLSKEWGGQIEVKHLW